MTKVFGKKSIITASAVALAIGLVGAISVFAATAVNLGTADNFVVLAGSTIADTTVSSNIISGDVGLSPGGGASITELTCAEMTGGGKIYDNDAGYTGNPAGTGCLITNAGLLTTAKSSLVTAYTTAASAGSASPVSDLGGQTLTPGVYEDDNAPDSMAISAGTKILTLDAQGDSNAVFIFKSGSTLTTASGSEVKLIGGAQACNVFWQVTSSATLGTGTKFKGNILALTSITDNGGSIVEGRLLARNGAVTLNNTTITKATCAIPPSTDTGGSGGQTSAPVPPIISVTKIPSAFDLPLGPGLVTYNYVVKNVGYISMTDIKLTDDKCSPKFVSGDDGNDSKLDIGEAWKYQCTVTLPKTTINIATVTGYTPYNGSAIDTASAMVVVGVPKPAPIIHVEKKPASLNLLFGGGAMTYVYTVTNPGVIALNDVSLADDKCKSMSNASGDRNGNGMLDVNETWTYTCKMNLTTTLTNTATAEGHANGLTAIDFALATVVVAPPGAVVPPGVVIPTLPNTGIDPNQSNTAWNLILLVGILAAASSALVAKLKRKRV